MHSPVLPGQDLPPDLQSPLDHAIAARDGAILAMVARALAARRACLAFQPVVRSAPPGQDRRPVFWEGLTRIVDPSGRSIPARDYMPAIEAHELGRAIDVLSLDLGFEALRLAPSLRLAINMSARSIGHPPWQAALDRGLASDPLLAERLILEISEPSAMLMPDTVRVFMHATQARGVSFALDDFGAGFTSLRHLRDFDFDLMKIDGILVRDIARSPDNQRLVRGLIGLAAQLEMFTVAETVEAPADADWLAAAGVDCLQGNCFGAPTFTPWWLIGDEEGRLAG